jgi:hypothetical protein
MIVCVVLFIYLAQIALNLVGSVDQIVFACIKALSSDAILLHQFVVCVSLSLVVF